MNKRSELIEALLALGKQAEHVAKLLSTQTIDTTEEQPEFNSTTERNLSLNIDNYEQWPQLAIKNDTTILSERLSNHTVLELNQNGKSVAAINTTAKIDLLTNKYGNAQPSNIKIINGFTSAKTNYDYGMIIDSLEFDKNHLLTLTQFKQRCQKIIIRFRPWTAKDGGFIEDITNKEYAHLVADFGSKVCLKVVRPLQSYEAMFASAGLTILERKITSSDVNAFFENDSILHVLKKRTWNKPISDADALRIMATDYVDYVVGK